MRIPVRYLEQYRFKYGHPQPGVGPGQGQPGDALGRHPGDGQAPGDGPPGGQPGEHTYDVEVPLEGLTRMMLEDLALPWMVEKPERRIRAPLAIVSRTFGGAARCQISTNAAPAHLSSTRNAITWSCRSGDRRRCRPNFGEDIPEETHANAAVYMLMDCSGSMTTGKKYIAKKFLLLDGALTA